MVAILSNNRDVIHEAVRRMYSDVALEPNRTFHFPTGRSACALVGYPEEQLDHVAPTALESFAGVGYPFRAAVIAAGNTVLDIGSGSGTDVLIASRLVGARGRVIALDMTAAMREKLLGNIALTGEGAANIEVLDGDAESIPLGDSSVDVVTTNGVINLVLNKGRAIREIARVLKRKGWLQVADIVVETLPSEACRSQPELWAECVVGATTVETYATECAAAGLENFELLDRIEYFAGSSNEETRKVANSFGAHSVVWRAQRR